MNKKIICKIVSAIITASIIMGALSFTVSAIASFGFPFLTDDGGKPDFRYVALGASNVNGYGVHGYNFDEVYEAPFEKEFDNRYGYKMDNPGAYPTLIRDKLAKKYDVSFSLIAMSSMRAEEVRLLLDESYWGDSYTDTWFYDTNGDGTSADWSRGAALYEWQLRAGAGIAGYNHTPTKEEGLKTLRDATAAAVAEADLITIDAGMNNFGTYMLNLLAGGIFTNDLNYIDPELDTYYDAARNFVLNVIKNEMGQNTLPEDMLGRFADTLAYALVGYCYNMDAVIERIYELNPDADVVVVSIQNMMHGLDIVFPGYEGTVPFGEIFGTVVNAANLYMATLSSHSDSYSYANVSGDGHTEFLLDEIAAYNGDPSTIGTDIKDCFDVYDGSMFLKTRVQQKFAVLMSKSGFVNIHESQADETSTESLKAFHYGFHYDIDRSGQPKVTLSDGTPLKDFIKRGEQGKLEGDALTAYEKYESMLSFAYDVVSEILREAALTNIMDLPVIFASAGLGISATDIVFDLLDSSLEKAISADDYEFDINKLYPNGFFDEMALKYGVQKGVLDTVFCNSIRMQFAGTAFCHPNANGHKQIADIVWNTYVNRVSGDEVIADQVGLCYRPTADSYYVAVGSSQAGYAELFADSVGLNKEQFTSVLWGDIDYSEIDKADLVSVVFSEGEMLAFAFDQMYAYIGNYISTDVRAAFTDHFSSAINNVPFVSLLNPKNLISKVTDGAIDRVLDNEMFEGKTMQPLDWSTVLEEKLLPMAETLRGEMKKTFVNTIGSEKITASIDIVELLARNAERFSDNDIIVELFKSTSLMYELLGDMAFFSIDISIADAIAYAMESYLYSYASNLRRSYELVSYVNENNPDAKIVIFGQFNPIKGSYLGLGDSNMYVGEMLDTVVRGSSLGPLWLYCMSKNSAFVQIFGARSEYDVALKNGEADADFLSLASLYAKDSGILSQSPESDGYIAEQMLCYLTCTLDNTKYGDMCSVRCNKCGEERSVDHRYNTCDDEECIACGFERGAVPHSYDSCEDIECNVCKAVRGSQPHVYDEDCTDAECNLCSKSREAQAAHKYDGCEDADCNNAGCKETRTAPQHSFGEWTVAKKATADKTGEKKRTCTECGHTQTEVIDKLAPSETGAGGRVDLSDGAVIGISVGSAVLIVAVGFVGCWLYVKKKKA